MTSDLDFEYLAISTGLSGQPSGGREISCCIVLTFSSHILYFLASDVDREYLASSAGHSGMPNGGGEISGRRMVTMSGDVLLGTVNIPLVDILKRKTGTVYTILSSILLGPYEKVTYLYCY